MTLPSDEDPTLTKSFFRCGPNERPIPTPGLTKGKLVGDFRLESLLGQGGMGQVWEARQESLSRQVAIKFVRPERVTDHQLALFEREARAGGRLSHSGIVAVYGHGKTDDLAWIAMELVPGAWDLRDFLDEMTRVGEVPPSYDRKVAQFIAEVADAVQAAHDAGVIHRDLKPQNIMISEDDRPKVTDFGLARIVDESALSVTGDFAGTYFYMSPEQVAARRIGLDHRTDIFSLGIVLYEMLTLVRPFQGDTEHQVAEQILILDPPDPRTIRSKIPRDLAVITSKALEKDRTKRYESMAGLAEDLRRWLTNKPIQATPPTKIDRAIKWCKRNPTTSIAGALTTVGTVIISVLLFAYVQVAEEAKKNEAQAKLYSGEIKRQAENFVRQKTRVFFLAAVLEQQDTFLEYRWKEFDLSKNLSGLVLELSESHQEQLASARTVFDNEQTTDRISQLELLDRKRWLSQDLEETTDENRRLELEAELDAVKLEITGSIAQLLANERYFDRYVDELNRKFKKGNLANDAQVIENETELSEIRQSIVQHLERSKKLRQFNSEIAANRTRLDTRRFQSAEDARRHRQTTSPTHILDYDDLGVARTVLDEATQIRAEELWWLEESIKVFEEKGQGANFDPTIDASHIEGSKPK